MNSKYLLIIKHMKVNSSDIDKIDYILKEQKLIVTFKRGETWIYEGVPLEHYYGIARAVSKGTYFDRFIKGRYTGRRQ